MTTTTTTHRDMAVRDHELLYPHQISARIHGADERLGPGGLAGRHVSAEKAGARATPQWLADLEMENQESIAFMGTLISGRPPSRAAHAPASGRRPRHPHRGRRGVAAGRRAYGPACWRGADAVRSRNKDHY